MIILTIYLLSVLVSFIAHTVMVVDEFKRGLTTWGDLITESLFALVLMIIPIANLMVSIFVLRERFNLFAWWYRPVMKKG